MSPRRESIGQPVDRVDGRLKVTGAAKYATEFPTDRVAHAVIITSSIAKGRVTRVDTSKALATPGVLAVITPQNAPRLPLNPSPTGAPLRVQTLLQNDRVHYNGQPIAVLIAETFELAMGAMALVIPHYEVEQPVLDMDSAPRNPPESVRPLGGARQYVRGNIDGGLQSAAVKVEQTYTTPLENHNPMEVHNTLATWNGDRLSVYDSTQGIFSVRNTLARTFGIPAENVRVVAHFTGGGFGSKSGAWSHQILAAMAAREVKRPVKLALTRRQMFGPVGGRPRTVQRIQIGASRDGQLVALRHACTSNTSTLEDWSEPALSQTRILYAVPNLETVYDLVRINVGSSWFQRAPGHSTGTFALESAIDELACALKMDPIALRLKNEPDRDPESGLPWSSRSLRECYSLGAEKFGWSKRNPKPRSMRNGNWLVGYGVATATYPAGTQPANTTARLERDGKVTIRAGTQEIGCGTYTVMSQIAADALTLNVDRIRFELGETDMPQTPSSVGSVTASSTGTAVHQAAMALRQKLDELLPGGLESNSAPALIEKNGGTPIEVTLSSRLGEDMQRYSRHSFGAVFTEVRVDPELALVRIPRIVTAHAIGRVLNEKTARSQIQGGVIWGIGMALLEETHIDPRTGRYVNSDIAEYQIPVNADVQVIDVHFANEHDEHVNPIGVKGAGEIGITGVAASIANAVYHATGKRVRDLPIRIDKLL
jgi:xanthine dehydrogenase YagR molybdenum-binding subunit